MGFIAVSMCVGVTVWFGWSGVVFLCRLNYQDDARSNKHKLLFCSYHQAVPWNIKKGTQLIQFQY